MKRRVPLRTSGNLLHIVQHQIHQLVVAFERAGHCSKSTDQFCGTLTRQTMGIGAPSRPPLNFTVISLSMYLVKSRIFSFLRSAAGAAPPPPPA